MTQKRGAFLVFDGPDGSGKTTQAARLRVHIEEDLGLPFLPVREPGGTPLGEAVRDILLDKTFEDMTAQAELLLYMASRAQLARTVILPALASGHVVVADRFLSASMAYQGVGGGLGIDAVAAVGRFAIGELQPDRILILDLDPETGLSRCGQTRDRIESRSLDYHRAVREGFREIARREGDRVALIDAARSVDAVWDDVKAALAPILEAVR